MKTSCYANGCNVKHVVNFNLLELCVTGVKEMQMESESHNRDAFRQRLCLCLVMLSSCSK